MNGAILINKEKEITSYGIVDEIKKTLRSSAPEQSRRRKDLPKVGHGGTLDPFATGLLVVLFGRACKLARYFLGATKHYEGTIRFGETTLAGDITGEISERTEKIPPKDALNQLNSVAHSLTKQVYLQTPPMHSAKKYRGKPLYRLARAGIEIDREPKTCHLYRFDITDYSPPQATFRLECSSGTYVRTLAQDFSKLVGSLGLVESLHRTGSGHYRASSAIQLSELKNHLVAGNPIDELESWIPFDRLLEGFEGVEVSINEEHSILLGQQRELINIVKRRKEMGENAFDHDIPIEAEKSYLALYRSNRLLGVAVNNRQGGMGWKLDSVFPGQS